MGLSAPPRTPLAIVCSLLVGIGYAGCLVMMLRGVSVLPARKMAIVIGCGFFSGFVFDPLVNELSHIAGLSMALTAAVIACVGTLVLASHVPPMDCRSYATPWQLVVFAAIIPLAFGFCSEQLGGSSLIFPLMLGYGHSIGNHPYFGVDRLSKAYACRNPLDRLPSGHNRRRKHVAHRHAKRLGKNTSQRRAREHLHPHLYARAHTQRRIQEQSHPRLCAAYGHHCACIKYWYASKSRLSASFLEYRYRCNDPRPDDCHCVWNPRATTKRLLEADDLLDTTTR